MWPVCERWEGVDRPHPHSQGPVKTDTLQKSPQMTFPPPFQSLTGESIYGMEIYAVFLSERRRICVSWSYFAQQRPFPSVPLESMEEEQPTAMPEDTHTHTPADDCRVEGLPLWPRGLDQHTHTHTHTTLLMLLWYTYASQWVWFDFRRSCVNTHHLPYSQNWNLHNILIVYPRQKLELNGDQI